MKHFSVLLSLFLLMASGNPVHSATWNVNNLVDFQTRLTEAQSNGQDDTINVAAGIYNVTAVSTLTYLSAEANTLTIQGAAAATTILDGDGSLQIMNVDSTGGGSGADITIRRLTFRNGNNAAGNGGGLYADAAGAIITVENCIFSNNTANGSGGAARMNAGMNGTVYFENNTVNGINSALSSSGGAVYINTADNGTLYIRNNTVTGTNTSDGVGGVLYANTAGGGTSIISGNTISGSNTGTRGGAIYANTASNSSLTISNNTISGTNTASSNDGGGVYGNTANDSTLIFSGNTIFGNNTAASIGGGAHLNGGSGTTITVVNNTISAANSASEDGGGLYVNAPSAGSLYLVNNTITGNNAAIDGGGVYISASGTANIYNNIIRDNSAGDDGDDLYVDTSGVNPVNLFNNILEDLVVSNTTNYFQGSNSTGNPLLGPLQDNGGPTFTRALPSNSPAINAGNNAIIATLGLAGDQRGYPRITDGTADIGAYEYTPALSVPAITGRGIIMAAFLSALLAVCYMRRQKRPAR